MVDEAKRQMPRPDFIIWTGDTPAHVEYTDAGLLHNKLNFNKLFNALRIHQNNGGCHKADEGKVPRHFGHSRVGQS
jgi:hypothetical protein